MKIRIDFVTNSSSSSFLVKFDGFVTMDDAIKMVERNLDDYGTDKEARLVIKDAIMNADVKSGNTYGTAKRLAAKILLDKDIEVDEYISIMSTMLNVRRVFEANPTTKFIITNEEDGLVNLSEEY